MFGTFFCCNKGSLILRRKERGREEGKEREREKGERERERRERRRIYHLT